jgi:hypothetical protein
VASWAESRRIVAQKPSQEQDLGPLSAGVGGKMGGGRIGSRIIVSPAHPAISVLAGGPLVGSRDAPS